MSIRELISKTFTFQGKEFTYSKLKQFKTLKVYEKNSRYERKLQQDDNGKLFLYEYSEEMGFPDDRIDEFYVLVQNEEDADALAKMGRIIDGRPHIYVGPNFDIQVRQ